MDNSIRNCKKSGVQFPPPSASDLVPYTEEEKSVMLRKTTDAVSVPDNVKSFLDEMKSTTNLLESILESMDVGEDPVQNDIAKELAESIERQKNRVLELIQEATESNDETFLNSLFTLFERIDRSLGMYNGGPKSQRITRTKTQEVESEEEFSFEESNLTSHSSSSTTLSPLSTETVRLDPEPISVSTNPFLKTPEQLGLEALASVSANNKNKQLAQKDPMLDWLLN